MVEKLRAVLDPYNGASDRVERSPQEEQAAKDALLEVLRLLKNTQPRNEVPQNGLLYMAYLEKLQHIYVRLAAGRFVSACNQVDTYLCEYPIEQRRIYDGLVLLLEKIKKWEF